MDGYDYDAELARIRLQNRANTSPTDSYRQERWRYRQRLSSCLTQPYLDSCPQYGPTDPPIDLSALRLSDYPNLAGSPAAYVQSSQVPTGPGHNSVAVADDVYAIPVDAPLMGVSDLSLGDYADQAGGATAVYGKPSQVPPGAAGSIADIADDEDDAYLIPVDDSLLHVFVNLDLALKTTRGKDSLKTWLVAANKYSFDSFFLLHSNELTRHAANGLDLQDVLLLEVVVGRSTPDQKASLLCYIAKNERALFNLCRHNHGSRVVDKMLDGLERDDEVIKQVVDAVAGYEPVRLMLSDGCRNIVQKLLVGFPQHLTEVLWYVLVKNVGPLTQHQRGCNVLSSCMKVPEGHIKRRLMAAMARHALRLSRDPNGNWVLQEALEVGELEDVLMILEELKGTFSIMAGSQYGSNVVERCLQKGTPTERWDICREIFFNQQLRCLVTCNFGNYVIQTALKLVEETSHHKARQLARAVMKYEKLMSSSRYGRPILNKIAELNLL